MEMRGAAIDLVVGGESIRYYPAGAALDGADVPRFDAGDERIARDHPRLRRVLVRSGRSGPPAPMVLHWSDGSDLRALDRSLGAGGTGADHFPNAVAGEFAQHVCAGCGRSFRVVDSSPPITFALGVPLENARRHVFQNACPNCGAPTRRALLEFLTPAPPYQA
jgi:hypothetical protein